MREKLFFVFFLGFLLENVKKNLYFDENAFFVIFKVIKMRKMKKNFKNRIKIPKKWIKKISKTFFCLKFSGTLGVKFTQSQYCHLYLKKQFPDSIYRKFSCNKKIFNLIYEQAPKKIKKILFLFKERPLRMGIVSSSLLPAAKVHF